MLVLDAKEGENAGCPGSSYRQLSNSSGCLELKELSQMSDKMLERKPMKLDEAPNWPRSYRHHSSSHYRIARARKSLQDQALHGCGGLGAPWRPEESQGFAAAARLPRQQWGRCAAHERGNVPRPAIQRGSIAVFSTSQLIVRDCCQLLQCWMRVLTSAASHLPPHGPNQMSSHLHRSSRCTPDHEQWAQSQERLLRPLQQTGSCGLSPAFQQIQM